MATSEVAASTGEGGFTHRQILVILSGLLLGVLLAALDQTIVSTAIRTIADDLDGYALQAWATTAYLITATLATPLYGKLSDMYGRKPFYLAAISIFLAGSLLCTLAQSMYELAAFRALQGLGAGGLMSLALTIVGDIVSPRERARYQGYFLAVFGTSSVLGPLLGGLFAGQSSLLGIAGWRWVFLVNVPLGLFALLVVSRVLRLPKPVRSLDRVDYWGVLVLALGITPLLVVAEQGREWGWGSGRSVLCYVIGGVSVAVFVAIEAKLGDAALIPLRIFRNPTFALGVVISFVVGAGMFGGILLMPQYLQVVRGASPMLGGLQMIPMVLGIMIGSIISGQLISRTGHYRNYTILGAAMITLGLFLMHYLRADTAFWMVAAFMLCVGFGLGNLMQPLILALQNALPPKDMGVSTGAATFFRQIGGTLGAAVFLSILFTRLAPDIEAELVAAGQDPAAAGQVLVDSSVIQRLDPVLAQPFQVGFANSLSAVFLTTSAVTAVALLLILFWKEVPLRTTAGLTTPRE
ncbi:MDR family MFS transporter [Nocardia huaxiensis]|uniref:MFS transporter n=1 Tax=Nocardia huaxiensis TaxID=2755382 RepID=A0A7D6VEZ9_9NOCA|nr:MDR family MFS transporter [Nocardia huaxiensis]QLY31397.1 MFS transporter [Nocardia huaxiensis]UFS94944.1 MFS transporter [Nocardia huaxiensis]